MLSRGTTQYKYRYPYGRMPITEVVSRNYNNKTVADDPSDITLISRHFKTLGMIGSAVLSPLVDALQPGDRFCKLIHLSNNGFGNSSLPQPMITYRQLDPWEEIEVPKLSINKTNLKCRRPKCGYFGWCLYPLRGDAIGIGDINLVQHLLR